MVKVGKSADPIQRLANLQTGSPFQLELVYAAAAKLSAEAGLAYQPAAEGESVSGVYRQRVTLSSGRFAMIDDGLGFQLVPWRPALASAVQMM